MSLRDPGQIQKIRDCPGDSGTVGAYDVCLCVHMGQVICIAVSSCYSLSLSLFPFHYRENLSTVQGLQDRPNNNVWQPALRYYIWNGTSVSSISGEHTCVSKSLVSIRKCVLHVYFRREPPSVITPSFPVFCFNQEVCPLFFFYFLLQVVKDIRYIASCFPFFFLAPEFLPFLFCILLLHMCTLFFSTEGGLSFTHYISTCAYTCVLMYICSVCVH